MREHDYFKINKINGGLFKYVLSTGPIDFFHLTLSKEQLKTNTDLEASLTGESKDYSRYLNGFSSVDELEKYIMQFVAEIDEEPNTIRYLSIPQPNEFTCDLIVIAKISNNGTCFIFSNNEDFLNSIEND